MRWAVRTVSVGGVDDGNAALPVKADKFLQLGQHGATGFHFEGGAGLHEIILHIDDDQGGAHRIDTLYLLRHFLLLFACQSLLFLFACQSRCTKPLDTLSRKPTPNKQVRKRLFRLQDQAALPTAPYRGAAITAAWPKSLHGCRSRPAVA